MTRKKKSAFIGVDNTPHAAWPVRVFSACCLLTVLSLAWAWLIPTNPIDGQAAFGASAFAARVSAPVARWQTAIGLKSAASDVGQQAQVKLNATARALTDDSGSNAEADDDETIAPLVPSSAAAGRRPDSPWQRQREEALIIERRIAEMAPLTPGHTPPVMEDEQGVDAVFASTPDE